MKLLKGKKEKVARTNIEKWINEFIFDRSITYANTHKTIAGVENIKRDMQDNLQKYNEEMQLFILQNKETIDRKYSQMEKASIRKKICIVVCLISFVMGIVLDSGFLVLVFAGSGIAILVFKLFEYIYASKYAKCIAELKIKAQSIDNKYRRKANQLYDKVDNLYLASLDPAHREVVLMRRDQARQHEELMREQRKFQQKQIEQAERQHKEDMRERAKEREIDEERRRRDEERQEKTYRILEDWETDRKYPKKW